VGTLPLHGVPRAFDQISRVYDSTREPVDEATLDRVVRELKGRNIAELLEVGIGTGRVGAPLARRGLAVTGLDASSGMLSRARTKGIVRLVRGSAYALPFRDAAFDAAFFVHVLHLLDRPAAALREGCRVGRAGTLALVRPPGGGGRDSLERAEIDPRKVFYECLEREGYPVSGGIGSPRVHEARLLREIPPDRLTVVSDREVTEPLARRIEMLEQGGSRHVLHVPAEVLRRAGKAARVQLGDRTVTYHRVEALATWSRVDGPTATT
jgi:SAM-dependent methyltransferase